MISWQESWRPVFPVRERRGLGGVRSVKAGSGWYGGRVSLGSRVREGHGNCGRRLSKFPGKCVQPDMGDCIFPTPKGGDVVSGLMLKPKKGPCNPRQIPRQGIGIP